MDLEKIIQLAKILSRPWQIATYILSMLLVMSIIGNIYLTTQEVDIILEQDYDNSNNNMNDVG